MNAAFLNIYFVAVQNVKIGFDMQKFSLFYCPPLLASIPLIRFPWRRHWGNGYRFLRQQSFALEWTQK